MKKNLSGLLFVILFILLSVMANSQDLPRYIDIDPNRYEYREYSTIDEGRKRLPDEALENPVYYRPYDVLHYDLYLDWYDMMNKPSKLDSLGFGTVEKDDIIWTGVSKMIIRIDTSELSEIRVDAKNLNILSVTLNGNLLPSVPPVINNELIIPLVNPAKKNDTIEISINYQHDRFLSSQFYRGFYLYPKRQYLGKIPVGKQDSVFVEERIAYTMSEPQDARMWFPCNDSPHDKATNTITVKVPVGYSVASNGLLQDVLTNDTAVTYKWNSDQVMATYLMHAAASKFKNWTEWYHKVTSPQDSIPLEYFVWQKDYDATQKDGSEYNARWAFETNLDQMKCFSLAYGEYPFKKYGIVALQPFGFGGMEHQTMTSVNRVWMRQFGTGGFAHELAHMWLGDLITCKTWNDIWINEGGATFSEAIWIEYYSGRDAYFEDMLGKRQIYLISGGSILPPIYGLPINTIFGNYSVLVYKKASWIYHMLRTMLGDDVFFPALRSILAKNSFTSVDSKDFENAFSSEVKNTPIPLDIYFKQWLMKSGHPLFNLNVSTSNAGKDFYKATVNLSQVQPADSISDIFEVPVRIIFRNESGASVVDTVLQRTREVTKEVYLPFYPTSVEIDTSHILCEVQSSITSVKEISYISDESVTVNPNPIIRGNIGSVSVFFSSEEPVDIKLVDLLGRNIKQIFHGTPDTGSIKFEFSTNEVHQGTYMIVIRTGNSIITEKVQIL